MKTKTFLKFLSDKNIPYEYILENKIEVFLGKYLAYDIKGNTANIFINGDYYDNKFPVENFIEKYKDYTIKDIRIIKTTQSDKLYYFYDDGENYKDLDNHILCKVQDFKNQSENAKQAMKIYFKKY